MKKIAVIGGGPAGMMAALTASNQGCQVLLIEQNKELGKKLTLTGGGRCNLTSSLPIEDFFSKIPEHGKFLYSAFYTFTNTMLMDFFEQNGTPLKIEGEKVYPKHESAAKIVTTLEDMLKKSGVQILRNEKLTDFSIVDNEERVFFLKTTKRQLRADSLIIAVGGLSFPSTGSDGNLFPLLERRQIKLTRFYPSLVQFFSREDLSTLKGISLTGTSLSASISKKRFRTYGDLLFTGRGISGPAVLNMSSYLTKFPAYEIDLKIDFLPETSIEELGAKLFSSSKKLPSTKLSEFLPSGLSKFLMKQFDHRDLFNLNKSEKETLLSRIKAYSLPLEGYGSIKESIVTKGGVSLSDISPSTMESKEISGLYFAGECLDLDALTGGYNLQIAFSTGYLAGLCAAEDR